MLIRIVRMTFDPEAVDTFLERFDETAPQIRAFPGCHHLELWRDADTPAVFTTHSHWESEEALEQYRHSDLFRSTWDEVKPLFDAQAKAQSYKIARSSKIIDSAASEVEE